jgi:adenine-specific DNA-methyltransferase
LSRSNSKAAQPSRNGAAEVASAVVSGETPVPSPEHLSELSREELLLLLQSQQEAGVRVTFSGKDNARHIARLVQPRVSKTLKALSAGPEDERARNQLIEGENLQAMVTLYRERGQVDLILTDPPYNTGQDFRYNDHWEEDPNDAGLGEFVSDEDPARHTKWMRFMWPRLQVMREMLKPSGVLAICIDHRELFRLGQMLDELFKGNRLGIINWQKSYAPRNDNRHLSTATEYVLIYARDIETARTSLLDRTASMNARYSNPDNDLNGDWGSDNPCAGEGPTHPGMVYGIQSPFTGEIQWPPDGKCWRSERPSMLDWLEAWGSEYESRDIGDGMPSKALILREATIENSEAGRPQGSISDPVVRRARRRAEKVRAAGQWPRLYFLKEGEGRARLKRYLKDVKKGVVPVTYWADEDYSAPFYVDSTSWDHEESGHSQTGITELDAVVGKGHGFSTVKPLKLFEKVIQLWCPPDGLLLDPFAGSGTSGHAILHLNSVAEATRRFILIEQGRPEKGDAYARTLCADRIRRVVAGDWASGKRSPLGGGFRFAALGDKVDAKAVLGMAREEMTDAVVASYFDSGRRGMPNLVRESGAGFKFLVARNADDEGFFLIWDGSPTPPTFDPAAYVVVAQEAKKAGLKATYHVYARFNLYQSEDVRFYQIPDRILMDFGISAASGAFHNDDAMAVELQ